MKRWKFCVRIPPQTTVFCAVPFVDTQAYPYIFHYQKGIPISFTMHDPGHSGTSQMRPGEINWEELFQKKGARWLHLGGIFTAPSESTARVAAEAMEAAKRASTIVSYDLNFRSKLWSSEIAQEITVPLIVATSIE